MGKMKQFANWLSECVYRSDMSDEEIIRAIRTQIGDDEKEPIDNWVLGQLYALRNNPKIYANMVDRDI